MDAIVIKVGGSILFPGKPDISQIKRLSAQLSALKQRPALVTGGGKILRDSYLSTLRIANLDRDFLDTVGILVARLNARVLAKFIKKGEYAETLADAQSALAAGKVPVMGGLKPRQSTDAVAAQLAEHISAKTLLVLTDVDGIYDRDPDECPQAKRFDKMSFAELVSFCKKLASEPGNYPVFDLVAAETVAKNKIRTIIGNGRTRTIAELLAGEATVIE